MELLSIQQLHNAEPGAQEAVVDQFYAVMAIEVPYLWGAIALATIVAGVAVAATIQAGKRTVPAAVAALWLILPPILLLNDLGRDRLVALALALP